MNFRCFRNAVTVIPLLYIFSLPIAAMTASHFLLVLSSQKHQMENISTDLPYTGTKKNCFSILLQCVPSPSYCRGCTLIISVAENLTVPTDVQ